MKNNFTLIFALLLCLFCTGVNAQTQFWSDTFEDSTSPSSGTRTPSLNQGGPSTPYTYYFIRTDGTNLNLQAPFAGDAFTTYQSIQGSKFWAGEDTDRVSTGTNDPADKVQNITWTGINITGKTGLTFKGLFAAHRNQAWQNPAFGATYDFLIVEYSIDGGAWTRIGSFNGDTTATNAGYLKEDTNGDNYGDGTELSKTFQEFGWSMPGTGTSLSLRFRVSADASTAQEFAIDNFRLFEAPVNTAPTNLTLSASTVNENVVANTAIGTLSSTDANAGNTFTYTLVAGTGSTDNASFNISGSDLRITASPDFETKSSYAIRLRTTDQGGLFFDKTFTITVNNVNEAPADLSLTSSSINENVAANTTVGTLSTTDIDTANTFTYSLVTGTGSTDNASFNISGSSLRITASPDFETKSSYAIRLRTTDQGSLTFDKTFIITINNLNEAPTDLAITASSINENVAANTTVGTLSTTDIDATNTFIYSLVAGTGSTDNASFNISGSSLRITASPDFETKSSYAIRLRTTDQGGLFFEKQFTITINDLCDLNNAVTQSLGILTATQSGATYQWYKCPSTLLSGAMSQNYTPSTTGDYKVDITVGGCTTTSACVTVSTLGNTDFETNSKFSIYPNPSTGIVNIQSDKDGDYQIVNQLGQTVKVFKVNATILNTINVENLANGIYYIKNSNNTKAYKLVIKK